MVQPPENLKLFESLLSVVEALRGPDGCPWDKEQTHRTLTPYAIEEAHELAEAIENGDEREMISELGDVLLQVVLHAEIGRQSGRFDISDVVAAIATKMVNRHPHVFGDVKVANSAEVLDNWSAIKALEKKAAQGSAARSKETSIEKPIEKPAEAPMRFDVPVSVPALTRSQKIGEKTKRQRFDWSRPEDVLLKVDEEIGELKEAMRGRDAAALEHEIGDVLFSTAQLARHLGLEAEQCLRTANARFEKRFFTMKKRIADSGRDYDQLKPDELETAWQETKAALASKL